MDLERVTRLRCAVSTFGPARRFIGESAQALELVTRNVVSDRLQGPGVESARHSITAIGAAIKKRFEMHRRDRAVFLYSGLDMHQDWMPSAMTIENFFTSQSALHWSTSQH